MSTWAPSPKNYVSVDDFGSATTLDATNLAISSTSDGRLVIPQGSYSFNGDILIAGKNTSAFGVQGYFTLDATGVRLTGTGRIIIDSCKRIKIIGLDAPGYTVHWRGCWWSTFEDLRIHKYIIGDADGASFSAANCNRVVGGHSQSVVLHENATSWYNRMEFYNHSMTGEANQGYTTTSDYAFEFLGNKNAQMWSFNGGDISYHANGIYNIGAANTGGDVDLTFRDVYFDTVYPLSTDRLNTKIRAINCFHANAHSYTAALPAALTNPMELWRRDKSFRHTGHMPLNLILNGDFRNTPSSWIGANSPISSFSGGQVTANPGGFSGTYLNLVGDTGAICYFTSIPLPTSARVTGTIILRNADAGEREIEVGIGGLYTQTLISDTEWKIVTATTNSTLTVGQQINVLVNTLDDTPYNVDVAYVGLTQGGGGDLLAASRSFRYIDKTFTWNPGEILAGASTSTTVSVDGAALGDFVSVSSSIALGAAEAIAHVEAAGQVKVTLLNLGDSALDLASASWFVRVQRKAYM